MSALDSALKSAPIESERQDTGLNLRLTPTEHWRFDARYTHTKKKGTDIFSGSFFFDATQLIEPVDYQTDEVEVHCLVLPQRGGGGPGVVQAL